MKVPIKVVRVPDRFDSIVRFAKRYGTGWRVRKDGKIVCRQGLCVLGAVLRIADPRSNKFPDDGVVSQKLDIPTSLALRIIGANDNEGDPTDRARLLRLMGLKERTGV